MIEVLFIILVFVAIIHYIYQSILLPTIRQQLRFRMFELRDQLRHLAYDEIIDPNSRIYKALQGRINVTVDYLYLVDLKALFDAYKHIKNSPTLRKQIEKNRQLTDKCELAQVKDIDNKLNKIFATTLLVNSACFFIWSGLFLLVLLTIHRTGKTLFNSIKNLVLSIPCVPEHEVIKFVPKIA